MDGSDLTVEIPAAIEEKPDATEKPAKRKFVTPEISVPVDVLDATTFFQAATSGITNP